jgi:hypothetical protein
MNNGSDGATSATAAGWDRVKRARVSLDDVRWPGSAGSAVPEGANRHCEPRGLGIRDARIYDWLDNYLSP